MGSFIEEKNIDMAKKQYTLLNRLYQNSDNDIKEKVYDRVKDAYRRIVAYTPVKPTEKEEKKKKKEPIQTKIKIDEEKINNLISNTHDLIKKKDIKKAKIIYAIGYNLYNQLSLKERKNIYPKLRKLHYTLSNYQ